MKRAIVSVDFDYFVREDMLWDWAHREDPLFFSDIWNIRYAMHDVRKGTDIETYADFPPEQLRYELLKKKMNSLPGLTIVSSDSHSGILPYLQTVDFIISLDAHHDLFNDKKPWRCDNWWIPFYDRNPHARHIHVYPKWSTADAYGDPIRKIEQTTWEDLKVENIDIQLLFFCRSSCWVPPHLDGRYNIMVSEFHTKLMIPERRIPDQEIESLRTKLQRHTMQESRKE